LHGGVTAVHGGGNSLLQTEGTFDVALHSEGTRLVRTDGLSWRRSGLIVGQHVTLTGERVGTYTVLGFAAGAYGTDDTLVLGGSPLAVGTSVPLTVTVTDALGLRADVNVQQVNGRNGVVRTDGRPWWNLGYEVGQRVFIEGVGVRIITGFDNSSFGHGTVLLFDGAAPVPTLDGPRTVAVVSRGTASGSFTVSGKKLTRSSGSWLADGFEVGMAVVIDGEDGYRTITELTATTMTLCGGAISQSTVGLVAAVRVGGDDISVTGGTSTTGAGGPDSPLVVYGDTQQDGIWYGGDPTYMSLHDFGSKPMPHEDALAVAIASVLHPTQGTVGTITRTDGKSWIAAGFSVSQRIKIDGQYVGVVTEVTDSKLTLTFLETGFGSLVGTSQARSVVVQNRIGNGADFFVFPLAHPFTWAGNDVIDASRAFSGSAATALPLVGLTIYGGAGDDTIYGSQAGDHLAGGSGDDTILGNRGVDHVYGDNGVNVDLITRLLTIPYENTSAEQNRDGLGAGRDLLHGDGVTSWTSGAVDSAFDDIVFGDHGLVTQNVEG
ncbi:MAG: hypothetical protein ACRDPR_06920, partial [Nocardioidaceae bacterium]